MPQADALQTGVECGPKGHACPQAPQSAASLASAASQPSAGLALQSANPGSQVPTPHALFVQTGLACAGIGQEYPQTPQFATESERDASHPSAGFPSQSAKPVAQLPIPQVPPTHAAVP